MAEPRLNLLTGEPIKYTDESDKGGNLFRRYADVTPDPNKPEQKPFIEDIANAFGAGTSKMWANAARTPAAVWEGALIPQNFLMKSLGRNDLQVQTPDWIMDNPVSEYYDSQAELFRDKISPKASFEEASKSGDWSGIPRSLALSVVENAPTQIGLIATYMAGTPLTGLVGMGLMQMGESLKEGREKGMDPAMNGYNSLIKGTIETGMESVGTMGVLKHWSKALTVSFGKKATREIMKDTFKAIFYSALGEGNEEFWTSLGQDFSDYATGANPDAMKGSLARAFEAGSVGALAGGGMTGPAAIRIGAQSASINKMQDQIYKAHEILQEESKPGFTPPELPDQGANIKQDLEQTPEIILKAERVKYYRGGGEGAAPAGTAQDIINYETDELGNKINVEEGVDLKEIPAKNTVWLTEKKEDAGEYGEVEEVEIEGGRVLARDNYGGVLIEKPQGDTSFEFGANAAEEVAPSKENKTISKLQHRLDQIQDEKQKGEAAKAALQEIEEIRKGLKGTISSKQKSPDQKVQTKDVPAYYKSPDGVPIDTAMQEANSLYGLQLESIDDFVSFLNRMDANRAKLKVESKEGKIVQTRRAEPTEIRNRIKNIRQGLREGKLQTKEEIKKTQTELIGMLEILEPKDKAKFIKTIKNIQTPEELAEEAGRIGDRVTKIHEQTKKAEIKEKIHDQILGTKNVRKGDMKVGKYDYESNMFFKDVRRIWTLNKTEALNEMMAMPEEGLSEMDLIKKRLLSLRANGAEASLEIYQRVLQDMKMLKKNGQEAKDEADFNKKIEKRENIDMFVEGAEKVTGGKTFLLSKIKRAYIKGFGAMHSFLNAAFGKKIADMFDPEVYEAFKSAAIYTKTKRISDRAAEIYGVKNVIRMFERLAKQTFEVTEIIGRGNVKTLTKMQLIDIYNSMKNESTNEAYIDLYGVEQLDSLMQKLDPEDKALGDMLQEEVQAYREIMNKRSIEIKGEDLGLVDNYWPRTSEHIQSVFDDYRVQGNTPRSIKARADKVIPKPQDAWKVLQRSVEEGEYVTHIIQHHDTLQRILRDRDVEHLVTDKFDAKTYKAIMKQLDALSLRANVEMVDAVSGAMGTILNNWVKAKLLSPTIYLRQWGSMSNYMENMPAGLWATGFTKSLKNPKQVFDYMWKTVPYLEARYHRGNIEALARVLDDAKKMGANQEAWTRGLTALVRSGDVSAIVFGGYPYLMYLQSKEGGGLSEKAAVKKFMQATLKSQQSPFISGTSAFQRNKSTGLLTAFKNTVTQYLRKMADATIAYKNKDIDAAQYGKVMTIYGIIQPIIYTSIGFAFKAALIQAGALVRGDDEEWGFDKLLDDIIVQIVSNPINAVPFFNSMVQYAARKALGQKGYNITSLPMISDVETALRKATKKEITFSDWVTIAGTGAEIGGSIPVLTLQRIYKYVTEGKGKSSGKGSRAGVSTI